MGQSQQQLPNLKRIMEFGKEGTKLRCGDHTVKIVIYWAVILKFRKKVGKTT